MNKVRTAKVATVDELKTRVASTSTAVVTEYRGMTVSQISTLRRQLRALDADYKVFKNSLVRRAIAGTASAPLDEFLEGPTAIAFVNGDVSAVAKALRDFARANPTLIVKGGVLDGALLTNRDLAALADLPSRDVLLARFAGLLASPLSTLAGLFKALPQGLAYGISALIDSKGGPGPAEAAPDEPVAADGSAPVLDEPVTDEPAPEAASPEAASPEAVSPEAVSPDDAPQDAPESAPAGEVPLDDSND